jgi:hypothetical protein
VEFGLSEILRQLLPLKVVAVDKGTKLRSLKPFEEWDWKLGWGWRSWEGMIVMTSSLQLILMIKMRLSAVHDWTFAD